MIYLFGRKIMSKIPTIQDLIDKQEYIPVYMLARYYYRIGKPIISDAFYDEIEQKLKSIDAFKPLLEPYFTRTYDDDPVPVALLNSLGLQEEVEDNTDRSELFAYLDEEKTLSISSVTSYEDAYEFLMNKKSLGLDVMSSLKMDGISTKVLYLINKIALALSRGRNGTGFDFTDTVKNVLPNTADSGMELFRITGESFVEPDKLNILREQFNADGYKTAKSSAISMLRVKHPTEYYKYVHTIIYNAEGLAPTLDETFQKLEELGFQAVPHKLIKHEDIPTDFEKFKVWLLEDVFKPIRKMQDALGMPADGLVLEVNSLDWAGEINNQYSTRQLACKFEYWAFERYTAIVEDIVWEQRRVKASIRLKIKPMYTDDMCEAKVINGFNLGILIENDIKVGDTIVFERNSGAVNILIHGKSLELRE